MVMHMHHRVRARAVGPKSARILNHHLHLRPRRSVATLFGAGWSDNLDKINCSILIVDCQYASTSTAAGASSSMGSAEENESVVGGAGNARKEGMQEVGAGVCNGTCSNCKSSKCAYARKHGIPLLSERSPSVSVCALSVSLFLSLSLSRSRSRPANHV